MQQKLRAPRVKSKELKTWWYYKVKEILGHLKTNFKKLKNYSHIESP